eukprot:1032195_1
MAAEEINVEEWLKTAKLTAYKSIFLEEEIAVEELFDLPDDDLQIFLKQTLNVTNVLHRNRFLKAITSSKASQASQQIQNENASKSKQSKSKSNEETKQSDAQSEDEDDEDDEVEEGVDMDAEIDKGRQLLSRALKQMDAVSEKMSKYINETSEAHCKQQTEYIEKVFDVFASKLMEQKAKLIDDMSHESMKQAKALQIFQSDIQKYKQNVEHCETQKNKALVVKTQQELIDDPLYTQIKRFSLPFIKVIIDQNDIINQINNYGSIRDVSLHMHPPTTAGAHAMISNTKSIITIQVGGCGNKMGNLFWNTIKNEYGLDNDLRKTNDAVYNDIGVYFREIADNKYIPRGISCDIDYCHVTPLLNKNNICQRRVDDGGSGYERGLWAMGFYTHGAELIDDVFDMFRQELETVDHIRGIQMHCNIGGGSGGGFGSLVAQKITDNYPTIAQLYFAGIPHKYGTPKQYVTPYEPYNVLLSMHQFKEFTTSRARDNYNSELSDFRGFEYAYGQNTFMPDFNCKHAFGTLMVLDNEISHALCCRLSGNKHMDVDFDKINQIHNVMINDITSVFRFESQTKVCIKSPQVSLNTIKSWAPEDKKRRGYWNDDDDDDDEDGDKDKEKPEDTIKKYHRFATIYTPSYVPMYLTNYQKEIDNRLNLTTLSQRITSSHGWNEHYDGPTDRVEIIFRGDFDWKAIKNNGSLGYYFKDLRGKNARNSDMQYIVKHVPITSQFTRTSVVKLEKGGGWMTERLRIILNDVRALYKKRDFIDKYVGQGMEEGEFAEAYENLKFLFDDFDNPLDFKWLCGGDVEEDEEDEDDDEEEEEEDEDDSEY